MSSRPCAALDAHAENSGARIAGTTKVVRTGTAIEKSRLPLRKWTFAIYINVTSLMSVSSMKLHRDLRVPS